jgi:hypothetical protein
MTEETSGRPAKKSPSFGNHPCRQECSDMKIVIAPDSYKGSLSAKEVARAIEKGFLTVFPECEVASIPMADGGEGVRP